MESVNTSSELKVLLIIVNDVRLCIKLESVEKVMQLVKLEKVPNSQHYLAGLLNIAGTSIPIFDLTLRLGLERYEPYTINTPIVICSGKNNKYGLIVDNILGIYTVQSSSLQLNKKFDNNQSLYIASVPIDSELCLLLNNEKLGLIKLSKQNKENLIDYSLHNDETEVSSE